MEIQNNEIRYSDIELNIELVNENEETEQVEDALQRTEDWHEQRKGNWTASQFKNMMASDATGGKIDWFNKEKVFRFSEGAIKYIYANAMERKTGRYLVSDSTKEMKYGTKIEPLINRRFGEYLKNKGLRLKPVGFKTFDNIPTAGVSSDAIVETLQNEIVASAEYKACSSWTTLFERTYESMDEKGKDFWQTQGQMEAWNVSSNYYVVISPPKDINVYLYSDNVMDLYEQWTNETEMEVQIVRKSDIHCRALIKRIQICESVVDRFLSEETNLTLRDILYEEIDYFKGYWETSTEDLIALKKQLDNGELPPVKLTVQEDPTQLFNIPETVPEQIEEQPIPEKKAPEIDMDNLPF